MICASVNPSLQLQISPHPLFFYSEILGRSAGPRLRGPTASVHINTSAYHIVVKKCLIFKHYLLLRWKNSNNFFCLVFLLFLWLWLRSFGFLRFLLILIVRQQTFELKFILILSKKYCMCKRTHGPKARQSYLFPPLVLTKNGRRGGE